MSTTDLMIPGTGELIPLDGPTDHLAEAFDAISDLERQLRDARGAIRAELLTRLDRENRRSAEVGDWKLEAEAPDQTDYDPDELAPILARLVGEEKISAEAMDKALERKVERLPRKRELSRLLGSALLTDDDRAAILGCAKPRTRERRLTVKRLAA